MTPAPILLDLDGTLADTLADICASANHLRRAFGLETVPDEVARTFIGDGVFVLIERCLAGLGPFDELRPQAYQIYSEHHMTQCTELVMPYPGVGEQLTRWRRDGVPLAVVTNKPARFSERIIAHLGWQEMFDAVVCGDTTPHKKPHPAPVHEALRRLGVNGNGAMMIGDSPQDVRAGRAAGVRTAAVLFGFHDEATLRAERADEYWVAFGQAE